MPLNKDEYPLDNAIDARLAEVVSDSPTPPSWLAAWISLGSHPTAEARLAVYQAVRAAGSIPDDAGFFIVTWILDLLTMDRLSEGMQDADTRLEEVRRKYGIDEDTPASGDVPDEYKTAMKQCHAAWDALYASTMDEFGEHDLARLFREDPDEFERRYDAGRLFFHRPEDVAQIETDEWLDHLHITVTECVEAESPMGAMGLSYVADDDFWEVWVYPKPVELLGGRHDGEVVAPGFNLDLEQLRGSFETVVAFGWNALGLTAFEGPYIHIEGVFRGRNVFLKVLAEAPEDEEPGLKLDTTPRTHRPE